MTSNQTHNKKILMKIFILLAILMAITTQSIVDIGFYNPLKDRSFSIAYNYLQNKHINGVEVYFTDNRISFRGCNTNWASYTLKSSGQFIVGTLWGSTRKACQIDYDAQIRNLFTNTSKIQELTIGRVDFFKGVQLLLILKPFQTIQPFNSLAGRSLLIQSTILGIDAILGIEVSFTENVISFTGCNKNSATYSIGANNRFSIDTIWFGTLRGCQTDYDASIIHLFSSSTKYAARSDGGVTFFDQKSTLIQLGPKIAIQPLSPLLGKQFLIAQTSSNNDKVIGYEVRFTETTLSFKGCNYNYAPYSIGANGKFSISDQWSSTLIYCPADYDSSVRQLFSKSKSFEVCSNGSISFFDQKSRLTIRLNVRQQIQPFILQLKGNFVITSNLFNIRAINGVRVSFNDGKISFKGCNTLNSTYLVGANSSFKITSIWFGTIIFCFADDYDKKIISLFQSAVRFETKDNGFAFFDKSSQLLLQLAPIQ